MTGQTYQHIQWERTWHKLEGAEKEEGSHSSVFDSIHCLVLLGPPGSGKSTELKQMFNDHIERGYVGTYIELRNVPSLEDLRRTLQIGASDTGQASTVFIDGLDEAPVPTRDISSWLVSSFKQIEQATGTLPNLRLTCRSADWPDQLTEDFESLWGTANVAVYQIDELSQSDVQLAAEVWLGSNEQKFVNEITSQDVWPLAKSPVTLQMLSKIFVAIGSLPTSVVETYRQGVLALIEERRGSGWDRQEQIPLTGKVKLLGRAAVVSVLAAKQVIWSGLYSDPVPSDAIAVSDLSGGVEENLPRPLEADERAFREVLKTAIFQADGPNRFRWAHLSFAEFLAADYLVQSILSAEQVFALLSIPEDGGGRIVPQLREVAAWLAGMSPPFRNLLISSEPDLLLRSDVASADQSFKSQLVEEVLGRLAEGEVLDIWRDYRRDFSRLNFPGLYRILKRYIKDKTIPELARSTAIYIARDCRLSDGVSDLLEIALDPTDRSDVRATSIVALGHIVSGNVPEALKSLIFSDASEDPQDEIRGAALAALWPTKLSPAELFECLSAPRDESVYGAYKSFLYNIQFSHFDGRAAVAALRWIASLQSGHAIAIYFGEVIEKALLASWVVAEHDEPARAAFADMLLSHATDHMGAIGAIEIRQFRKCYESASQDSRRLLLEQVAAAAPDADRAIMAILYGPWQLVIEDDLRWVLSVIPKADGKLQAVLIRVALVLIGKRPLDEVAFVWDVAATVEPLQSALSHWFSTDVSSPMAKWAREDHQRKLAKEVQSSAPPLSNEIDNLLARVQVEPGAWWRINFALLAWEGSDASELVGNLKASKHWRELSVSQQEAIEKGADRYLIEYTLPNLDWVGTNTIYRPAAAGYRALRLLYDRTGVAGITPALLSKWVSSILWFATNDGQSELFVRQELAGRAYLAAADEFRSILRLIVDRAGHLLDVLRLIETHFDSQIAEILRGALGRDNLEKYSREQILKILIANRDPATLDEIRHLSSELLNDPQRPQLDDFEVYQLAHWLVEFPAEAWPILWPLRLSRPGDVKNIWLRISGLDYREWPILSRLNTEQLADIFIWLSGLYPDRDRRVSGLVTPDDQLRMMMVSIMEVLVRDGGDSALSALTRIQIALPDDSALPWYIKRAKDVHRSAVWRPAVPRDVVKRLGFGSSESLSRTVSIIATVETEAKATRSTSAGTRESAGEVSEQIEIPLLPQDTRPPSLRFLLVGTEWASNHGGVSTFNREFAIALASRGHSVVCLVPCSSAEEKHSAASHKVELRDVTAFSGYIGQEVLDSCTPLPDIGANPDYIVGHDHVTGRAALRIRDAFLPGSKYAHVVHTIPSETDQYKSKSLAAGAKTGREKSARQEKLCRRADYVIAIGPKLADHFKGRLSDESEKVFCLIPGLNQQYLAKTISQPDDRNIAILWSGRTDDPDQKGLPIVMNIAGRLQREQFSNGRQPSFVIRGIDYSSMLTEEDLARYAVDRKVMDWREYTADAAELYKDLWGASCSIMPSQTEAFGLAALEAIALGVPVLVSSFSGIGMFLLQELPLKGLDAAAKAMVLDVSEDSAATGGVWADALRDRLRDRNRAFAIADQIRQALKDKANWDTSLSRLESFLG